MQETLHHSPPLFQPIIPIHPPAIRRRRQRRIPQRLSLRITHTQRIIHPMNTHQIRLQKFLSERGIASRRHAGELIAQGLVTVNGEIITEPGKRISPDSDKITFKSKSISSEKETSRTIVLYKPRGYVCSTKGQNSRTIYELITDIPERLVPIGRLDKDSEGLLLMSNDGDLVNSITHPRFGHEKTYNATVSGTIDSIVLEKLQSEMIIDGYRIRPVKVKPLINISRPGYTVLEFKLKEGRNRQIRKMCNLSGLTVHRLIRTQIGNLTAENLEPGQWRDLPKSSLPANG